MIRLEGFKEFNGKLNQLPKRLQSRSSAIVKDVASQWARDAKRAAPKDQGKLIGQIQAVKVNDTTYEVISPSAYSQYVEFGTKRRKNTVINGVDYSSYAQTLGYKKTGDYFDFLNSILDWVKRKGLSRVVNSYTGRAVGGRAAKENLIVLAQAIANSIMRHGIKPHPFFFLQRAAADARLRDELSKIKID